MQHGENEKPEHIHELPEQPHILHFLPESVTTKLRRQPDPAMTNEARSANDMDEVQTGIKQVKGEKAVEHRRKDMRELVLIFDQLVVGKQCAEEQR